MRPEISVEKRVLGIPTVSLKRVSRTVVKNRKIIFRVFTRADFVDFEHKLCTFGAGYQHKIVDNSVDKRTNEQFGTQRAASKRFRLPKGGVFFWVPVMRRKTGSAAI